MEAINSETTKKIIGKDMIKYLILIYWSLFWLLNIIDKIIGGAVFLFVGKDRFATFERFFDSLGLGAPVVANIALIISAGLEIFAFVFFAGALIHFIKKNAEATRSWFFMGILFTLTTFTFFSIGDQIFGDHGELLEHGIYWIMTILTWFIFIRIDNIQIFKNLSLDKKQAFGAVILTVLLVIITTFSIFRHNQTSFIERTQAVNAVKIDDDLYKIEFPFLAGSKAFENSIAKFLQDNPSLNISYIYTTPTPLKLGKSEGLIIYIQTNTKK